MATAGTWGQPPWATIAWYFLMAALVAAMFCRESVGLPSAGLTIIATSGSPTGNVDL